MSDPAICDTVAYYPFNTNAIDESGNKDHGSIFGARFTNDRFGHPTSAYELDGVNDYIIMESEISGHAEFTQSLWLWILDTNNMSPPKDHQRHVIQTGDGGIYYWPEDKSFRIDLYKDRQGGQSTDPATRYYYHFNIGNLQSGWNHIAFVVHTDDTAQFFVNGTNIEIGARITDPGVTGDYAMTILGATINTRRTGVSEYMAMRIDDIRIFDCALNATEILSLYTENESWLGK